MNSKTITGIAMLFCSLLLAPHLSWVQAAPLKFEHVMNIGSEGRGAGQFKCVEDFAFTRDGRLLVTDASHSYVQLFNKTSGAYIARFGGKGDDDESLEKPEGIAVDPQGNIFVADYTTGYVKEVRQGFQLAADLQRLWFGAGGDHEE